VQRTRLSVEFNASFCRGLLETRYGEGESHMPGCSDESAAVRRPIRRVLE
jgi:hypothetical protein